MSTDNIVRHPAFGNPPVKNPRRPGRRKGTISLNVERQKRSAAAASIELKRRHEAEDEAADRQANPMLWRRTDQQVRLLKALERLDANETESVALMAERLGAGLPAA